MAQQIPAVTLLTVELASDLAAVLTWEPYTADGFFAVSGQIQAKDKRGLFVFARILTDEELAAGQGGAALVKKLHPGTYDCSIVVDGYDAPYQSGVPYQEAHGSWARSNLVELTVSGGKA